MPMQCTAVYCQEENGQTSIQQKKDRLQEEAFVSV